MSKVTDALIKEIADAINTQVPQQKESRLIGTIVGLHKPDGDTDETRKYYKVQLDGSDELTPALASCACDIGDRVTVGISNHTATITGNLSSALFVKSVNAYFQLIDDGLIVGRISEDGTRTGGYVKISGDMFEFYSASDEQLATYSPDSILFGDYSDEVWPLAEFGPSFVSLLEDKAIIEVLQNEGHYVLTLEGNDATGLRAADEYGNKAEVIAWGDRSVAAALQVVVAGVKSSIQVNGTGAYVTVPYGTLFVNGYEVVNTNNLFSEGTVKMKGKIASGDSRLFSTTVNVPDGCKLAAIREVATYNVGTNGSLSVSSYLQIMNFRSNAISNEVSARIYNSYSEQLKVQVTIKWVALKASNIYEADEIDIDLDPPEE